MLKYSHENEALCHSIECLPKDEKMIPLYLNLLKCTDNHVVRGEIAYLLSQFCPQNTNFIELLLELLVSDKTHNARGSLLYALEETNYFSIKLIEILVSNIVAGNYECRLKAHSMLHDLVPKTPKEQVGELQTVLEREVKLLEERLCLLQEIFELL